MSSRRSSNEVDAWLAFCRRRKDAVERLSRLGQILTSATRFDEYLRTGDAGEGASLPSLDDEEWQALKSFVDDYERDWQSWFVRSLYVAYYTELDRR